MITAIVLIQADPALIPEVASSLAELEKVSDVYSVTGDVDLIAVVRVAAHEELADVIADEISKTEGVNATTTYIAFRSYSKQDLEQAFDLGLD